MCQLCDAGQAQDGTTAAHESRRDFLKASAATAVTAAGMGLLRPPVVAADHGNDPPEDHGKRGRRYVIRGGYVMTLDPSLGDFAAGDVLVEGSKIVAVGPHVDAGRGASVIDARGRVVMPGFIDTHHHQFETALRSFLANGILINDGSGTPSANPAYYEFILQRFAPVYRPEDVYINILFGGLAQLDAGVTTCHDISQIHHSPQHSDAAVKALFDTGRRAALGYFESAGEVAGNQYPQDAVRLKQRWFSSSDQLVHMIMGGEVYLGEPTYTQAWTIGRQLGFQVAAHILSPFGIRPILDDLAQGTGGTTNDIGIGPDNLFIHMTGMSDLGWNGVKNGGAQVSIAFPIEMNMRHGMPPILKLQSLGMEPSLSSDVEVTMTADFFAQMRGAMTMQRLIVNQMILEQGDFVTTPWPTPAPGTPKLLNVRDVLRFATVNGARHLRLDDKTGSLTPGKEADIILLDATALNVAPLNNVPGAVVSLMDRTNVETVIVAGKIRKWKGELLGVNLSHLRHQLENSRDYIFAAAKIPQDPFGQ
jgi:cytosine/adenosine deaminase-related metal-dependent hydrolase